MEITKSIRELKREVILNKKLSDEEKQILKEVIEKLTEFRNIKSK